MDDLAANKLFSPPDIKSLEEVIEYAAGLGKGRVFADAWDLTLFTRCSKCIDKRIIRLTEMNHTQKIIKKVICTCDI